MPLRLGRNVRDHVNPMELLQIGSQSCSVGSQSQKQSEVGYCELAFVSWRSNDPVIANWSESSRPALYSESL